MILPILVHGWHENVAEWMRWLRDEGCVFVALPDALEALESERRAREWAARQEEGRPIAVGGMLWMGPQRAVLLTFDDHPQKHVGATPLMQRLGTSFTSYVCTGEYRGVAMDAGALKEMVAAGWDIGAHTHTHRDLSKLNEFEIASEIATSRLILQSHTNGALVRDFATPFGRQEPRAQRICKQLGFRSLRTTDQGVIGPRTDPFWLPSRSCDPSWPLERFKKIVAEIGEEGERV